MTGGSSTSRRPPSRLPSRWPLALLLLLPPSREQCGIGGGRERGGRQRPPPTPPQTHSGGLGSPQACPVQLGRVVASRPLLPWLPAGKGGPPLGLGSSGKGVPPSLLSHIWQSSGMASPHPSSSSFSWRRWAAFPALHGDPRGGERGRAEPGWWDGSRRERDAVGHPAPVTPRSPPSPVH